MIHRNRTSQEKITRHIIWYDNTNIGKMCFSKMTLPFYKIYPNMFIEDVKGRLFPYTRKASLVEVIPENATKSVVHALDSEERNGIQETLWRLCDKGLVYNLLVYGRAHYEIIYHDNGSFEFEDVILEHSIIHICGKIYQYIPRKFRKERKLPPFKLIPNDNIFCIQLSRVLKRKVQKLIKELIYLSDNSMMPNFSREALMSGKGLYHKYNTSWYHKASKKIFAKATKDIGWNGRSAFKEEALEYYVLVKMLRFERFKCQLRTTIINGINDGLSKAVKNGVKPVISADGLPSNIDIDNALKSLLDGDKRFNDIISPFWLYS